MANVNEQFKNLIFYEIYPTSFYDSNGDGIGDLKGIEEKLEYIKETGFNAIWLNPFYDSPFMDGGYDVRDFYKVDSKFGTNEDFVSLAKKAREMGIIIIVDLVPGHSSEENREFKESGKHKRNEYSDLFIWSDTVWTYDPAFRMISGRHERDASYIVNFFSMQPAFNYGFNNITNDKWQISYKDERCLKARDYMVDVMKFWMSLGASGFRVDMADSLVKNDDDERSGTREVWHYIFESVRKDYPDIYLVSESGVPRWSFSYGFNADFTLDFYDFAYMKNLFRRHDGKTLLKDGERFDEFMENFKESYECARKYGGIIANVSGNHDEIRNYTCIGDIKRSKLFYLFMMSLPGTPFIYYGDEILMEYTPSTILPSKDGGYYRTGCRTPMQWDNSKNMGFSSSDEIYLPVGLANKNNVKEMMKDKESFYHYLKDLILLRKSTPDLTSFDIEINTIGHVIEILRGSYALYMNFSDEDFTLNGEVVRTTGKGNVIEKFEGALIKRA